MFATQAGIAIDNARLAEDLHASEEAFRLAFEGAGTGMTLISLDPADPGRFLRVNDAMCAITGYTVEELIARTFNDITHPDDRDRDRAAYAAAVAAGDAPVYRAEKRYIRADDRIVWVAITTTVVKTASGELRYGITQVEDISARRAAESELRDRATRDPLTGLANRTTLTERLADILSAPGRADGGSSAAVLFCDLDGFKPVNDTYGHEVGDRVLGVIAARLLAQVRGRDTVARLGGDEFVVLAHGTDVDAAERLAARIAAAVASPITVGEHTLSLTVSIGLAPVIPASVSAGPGGRSAAAVLREADAAMYRAKAAGRSGSHARGLAATGLRL
jgi:diguanylate cyclase (GGDEF)-like protein/PAS domain S-box-containing protein